MSTVDPEYHCEQSLWAAVIQQMFTDAFNSSPARDASILRAQARRWLTKPHSLDRDLVCESAGTDGDYIRRKALEQIAAADAGKAMPIQRRSRTYHNTRKLDHAES